MLLKETITKYDTNKCTECGRHLQKGWKIYVDVDAVPKKPYCKDCGEKLLNKTDNQTLPNTRNQVTLEDLVWKVDTLISNTNKMADQIKEVNQFVKDITETWKAEGKNSNKRVSVTRSKKK